MQIELEAFRIKRSSTFNFHTFKKKRIFLSLLSWLCNGQIGFCWTPYEEVAEIFASGLNYLESGGVLLKCEAPTKSILSAPNPHRVYLEKPTRVKS